MLGASEGQPAPYPVKERFQQLRLEVVHVSAGRRTQDSETMTVCAARAYSSRGIRKRKEYRRRVYAAVGGCTEDAMMLGSDAR